MEVKLFNTLVRKIEKFKPIQDNKVKFYTCGPTVYNYAHIGNLRTYLFEDFLKRVLLKSGYDVAHVMNVTDVGHLESDADDGEDKMSLASKREAKSPWEIAKYYEKQFFKDLQELNIIKPNTVCRATEHIGEMQNMVKILEEKGFTYTVDGNVYFSVERFPTYDKLGMLQSSNEQLESRVEADPRKKNPKDFVLWFSQSKYPNQIMKWDSAWGVGFPGWHIECSAMASKYLGDKIDIHAGGVDHITVHHTNEVAQSEGCFGHKWINYWVHGEFLVLDKGKMSKSSGKFLRLKTLLDEGFSPLHYRYLCFGAHYRTQLFFSFEALQGAKNAFESLKNRAISWRLNKQKAGNKELKKSYQDKFWQAMANDLDSPTALSVVWDMAKNSALTNGDKYELLLDFDQVLGFDIANFAKPQLSQEIMNLIEKRNNARANKDWAESDLIRNEILKKGVQLKDTPQGTDWYYCYKD